MKTLVNNIQTQVTGIHNIHHGLETDLISNFQYSEILGFRRGVVEALDLLGCNSA
jgi:hypothetical protein